MDTPLNTSQIKSGSKSFPQRCIALWTSLITIGITNELTDWQKKRTRILNGICIMSVIILGIYCFMYMDYEHRLTFWESFAGLVASAIPVYLNFLKKYNTASHFFCISNLLSYSFQSVSHGYVDGVEYILVANSIASVLFFRNIKIVITYFLLNGLFFAGCKYSFTVIKPFLFMPPGENLYNSNHIILFVIVFMIVLYFKKENERQEGLLETKNINLSEEKQKSDELLLNILPYETAEELKQTGTAKTKSFDLVTVLFTDFVGFTIISEKLSPEKLVEEINFCFSAFDNIISKYDIEKIKTIGDSYMCAGGLPKPNNRNPGDVVNAAIEIQEFMLEYRKEKLEKNEPGFELRLGIHSGPVVAGIVGIKKFAYDIWGDTVNTASRIESSGERGKVNISGSTYELVKEKFNCTYRGKIPAKNKGEIDMYFVEKIKPEDLIS